MQRSSRRAGWIGLVAAAGVMAVASGAAAAECKAPRIATRTVLGMQYCADPAFAGVIQQTAQKIRQDVRPQRQAGKLIIYASTPISPRGGGYEKVNLEIAASVKSKLEKEYGSAVWVLDPGKYQMEQVDGKWPGGGEYMVMFTDVLAGEDGTGKDFDMVHFTGPADMRAFFGCSRDDLSGCVERWLETRAAGDEALRRDVAQDKEKRAAFIRYYTMRASSSYSSGAHDEWNIVVKINKKRPLGEQVAMFFEGRPASPAEMETEISPGYEVR
jgi:hypothetical protein